MLCSNNSFKSKLRHLIKHCSVNIIMKQLCLVMTWTGQRKFPRPFYIPADDKVIHTIESISYKFVIYTFYTLSGKYRTYVFRSSFFVVKERALPSNSYISACQSQCIFWLKRKHCDLILILFFPIFFIIRGWTLSLYINIVSLCLSSYLWLTGYEWGSVARIISPLHRDYHRKCFF